MKLFNLNFIIFRPSILKNVVEYNNSANHDQSNTQDKTSKAKEAIYLEKTLSTENVLKKSGK